MILHKYKLFVLCSLSFSMVIYFLAFSKFVFFFDFKSDISKYC